MIDRPEAATRQSVAASPTTAIPLPPRARRPDRPTLREVAAAAGVDVSTASRLLRGQNEAYRPETRERVLTAAENLGYRPNAQARALRLRRQQAIGLLVPDLDNFGVTQIMRGVQEIATERDYTLMVVEAGGALEPKTRYQELGLEGKVDGVLVAFASVEDPHVQEWATREQLPMVLVQRGAANYPASVVMNEELNVSLMVDHLVSLGHRRIGHISGPSNTDTGLRRCKGFKSAMHTHGLAIHSQWICDGQFQWRGGQQAALRVLDQPAAQRPTALVAANLPSALGVLSAARELGLSVPRDVSVIALDEHIVAAHTDPPLTAVKTPQRELGRQAAHMLLDVLAGQRPHNVTLSTPPELVVRASTAPPPADK